MILSLMPPWSAGQIIGDRNRRRPTVQATMYLIDPDHISLIARGGPEGARIMARLQTTQLSSHAIFRILREFPICASKTGLFSRSLRRVNRSHTQLLRAIAEIKKRT